MANESEVLKKDIEELRASMEKLTKDVGALSRSLADELKARASRTAASARESAEAIAHEIGEKGRESTESIERTVRERPFQSLLVAFGAGLLLAQVLRKR
jgi:ElaB/YqjD/DUF883 family membrane-anchored ribosome-binding protein